MDLNFGLGKKKSEIAGIGDYSLVNNEGKACLEMSVKSMSFANICNFCHNKDILTSIHKIPQKFQK